MIHVYDYYHFGRGIGKVDGEIIFIDGALKDEDVTIKDIKERKGYKEAKVDKIIKKSPNRVDILCPYYDKCGGCQLLHLNYKEQLDFKENKIKNIMNKYYKKDLVIKPIISTNQFNYRNKLSLKIKKNKVGLYEQKSNKLVPIDKCLLVSEKINELIQELKRKDLKGKTDVILRSSFNLDEYMISFLNDDAFILEKLGDLVFKISANSFFQVNTLGALKLYNKVLEYLNPIGKEKVLDLYCGTGTISIFISKYVKEVVGIEIVEDAIRDANSNKEMNGIDNVKFICKDVANLEVDDYDVVILDPPRKGLDDITINKVLEISPKKIIYVSCDPMTLARDLKKFDNDYNVIELTPVDMFPNTYHCESITILERK